MVVVDKGAGDGFAWLSTGSLLVYSCYCTPRWCDERFSQFLADLGDSITAHRSDEAVLVVGGDFNAHSADWGSATEDVRGGLLSDFAAGAGLDPCNTGFTPTYSRVNAQSVVDVTFVRLTAGIEVSDWEVLDRVHSASDHRYIVYKVDQANRVRLGGDRGLTASCKGWATRKLDRRKFFEAVKEVPASEHGVSAEDAAAMLESQLVRLCNSTMPCRTGFVGRRAVHWWSDRIDALRRNCNAARRRYKRQGRRSGIVDRSAELAAYREAAKRLRTEIRSSQERCWVELCNAVENDPWGIPYKVVTKKLGRQPPGAAACGRELAVARELFPNHPPTVWSDEVLRESTSVSRSDESERPLTVDELKRAARRLPSGKAPGPDLIPNEILALLASTSPEILLNIYNKCWIEGIFPSRWKIARLVLLYKGAGKPATLASSFRPLSLLNGVGKLFERLVLQRLSAWLDENSPLSNNQYGFRAGRSTVDAIRKVVKIAGDAAMGPTSVRDICAVATIDVTNAFNTAPWPLIDAELRRRAVPRTMIRLLRSYMSGRQLVVEDLQGDTRIGVTCGVPQGSVLGPLLWNVFYDSLLRLRVPRGVELVGYADDVAVVVRGHNADLLELIGNPALEMVRNWMTANGLSVAPHKSEVVVLTGKRSYRDPVFTIGGLRIPVKRSISYLGVTLDTRLNYNDHVLAVTAKARSTAAAIGRLMPNMSGPSQAKRSLLMSVVHSKLLYAAPVWARSVEATEKNRNALSQSQRVAALRITRCYRTVSDMAALVLARMPPAHLLAGERARIYEVRRLAAQIQLDAPLSTYQRNATLRSWQQVWEKTKKGAWTKRMIPDVERWVLHSKLRAVTFHLAQALTGHGCFQRYLFDRKLAVDPGCVQCGAVDDTVEHTIFECKYWNYARQKMENLIGRRLKTEDVPEILLGLRTEDLPENQRDRDGMMELADRKLQSFQEMVEGILLAKEEEERTRQIAQRANS